MNKHRIERLEKYEKEAIEHSDLKLTVEKEAEITQDVADIWLVFDNSTLIKLL